VRLKLKGGQAMFEDLKKKFDKGVDYAFATKEKIEKAVTDFATENNLNKEEARKLLDQVVKKSEETRKTVEEKIVELQKAAISKMNLVTKEDYRKLEARLSKLEASQKKPVKARSRIPKRGVKKA
jgi:polyhydroxyalkanoate synthesis regulator phasin